MNEWILRCLYTEGQFPGGRQLFPDTDSPFDPKVDESAQAKLTKPAAKRRLTRLSEVPCALFQYQPLKFAFGLTELNETGFSMYGNLRFNSLNLSMAD